MTTPLRKLAVFTGNRAEYGLQMPILRAIADDPRLDYRLLVSGAHLKESFGRTLEEIERDGFEIHHQVRIDMPEDTLQSTAHAIGSGVFMVEVQEPSDWVVLTEFSVGDVKIPMDVCHMGVGFDLAPHALGDRDLTGWSGLARAWKRALRAHGAPPPRIDLAEPSCVFAHEEELFRHALELDPATEVSPGGGLFAGFVPVAAGLSRLVAVVRALRAPGGARAGVAHGTWGPAGQGQAVAILEAA